MNKLPINWGFMNVPNIQLLIKHLMDCQDWQVIANIAIC
jgi:hypothetical protein